MLSLLDFLFVYLRQTVDIVMIAFDAEILCEIDDLPMRLSWTSDTRLPALLSELANTISASGWLISRSGQRCPLLLKNNLCEKMQTLNQSSRTQKETFLLCVKLFLLI